MTRLLELLFGRDAPRDGRASEASARYTRDEAVTDAHRAAASAGSQKPIEFDMERMERALKSPRIELPQGLTPEQLLECMLASDSERK